MNAQQWIERFADDLGVPPPTPEEFDALLGLAANAAHASERTAAPVACWLAAKAGMSPTEARERSAAIGEAT
jgi:hypothetical protein